MKLAERALEPAGRTPEPSERASVPAGRALEPARKALELAGRVTKQARRALEPAVKALELAGRPGASWEGQLRSPGVGTEEKDRERTECSWYVVVPLVIVPYRAAAP